MDAIFDFCVQLLIDSASYCGVSYKEMNVIVFVIVHPLITILMLFTTLRLWVKKKPTEG